MAPVSPSLPHPSPFIPAESKYGMPTGMLGGPMNAPLGAQGAPAMPPIQQPLAIPNPYNPVPLTAPDGGGGKLFVGTAPATCIRSPRPTLMPSECPACTTRTHYPPLPPPQSLPTRPLPLPGPDQFASANACRDLCPTCSAYQESRRQAEHGSGHCCRPQSRLGTSWNPPSASKGVWTMTISVVATTKS